MSDAETGGPAFPALKNHRVDSGMTLRDYFAGKALTGILADPEVNAGVDMVAMVAYAQADAMLKARNK